VTPERSRRGPRAITPRGLDGWLLEPQPTLGHSNERHLTEGVQIDG
jgi:hypothetical protein